MRHEEGGFSAGPLIFSFFLGGLIGAGFALLLAPKTGKELRGKIKELAEDAKEKVEEVKGKMTPTLEKGKEILQEKKSILTTAIEAGKEAYEKEKEKFAKAH